MDVFPLLSPHFSPFWCVCCLIPSLQPTPPILTLSCCHSHGAGCNILNTLVTDCESRNVSSKSFPSLLKLFLFVSKQRHNAVWKQHWKHIWVCDVYVAHKSWTDSQAKKQEANHTGDLWCIQLKFTGTSMAHSWCLLAFWIQLSHFWWMSSSIVGSVNTPYFNLCFSGKYSGNV